MLGKMIEGIQKKAICGLLLEWYGKCGRKLPWRGQPNLYKTVVSEFMLQQTQVKTVLPYFEHWMLLFPNFEALAMAQEELVLKTWAGLGYYSRAKRLQLLAKAYLRRPAENYEAWLSYEGIGNYTAAAIVSIAFNEPVAVVDGNVVRVLSRLLDLDTQFKSKEIARRLLAPVAQEFLCLEFPGRYNEAIMELGALVCTKRKPGCQGCPLRGCCRAYQHGTVASRPCFVQPRRTRGLVQRYWIRTAGMLLLETSRVGRGFAKGLLELPELNEQRLEILGQGGHIFSGLRSIGTKDFEEKIYLPQKPLAAETLLSFPAFRDCRLIPLARWKEFPYTGPHRRWIERLLSLS
jgi:A/G-specific adenine glycosylase